jgi:hypothetical protein
MYWNLISGFQKFEFLRITCASVSYFKDVVEFGVSGGRGQPL